jgi:alpha-beta hydrolase superfamily lysophospholipase
MSEIRIEDFKEQTLELGEDYEGRVIATLVHSPNNENGRPSLLYLHGFNDYFFQAHLAEKFNEQGYNFYALDLRKYGRSLLPHQHPNYCRSITEYFEDLNRSIEIIKAESNGEINLLGHSTGGLIAAAYLNDGKYRNQIYKLVLNSPFLEFNITWWQRLFLLPAAGFISSILPYSYRKKAVSHLYAASISDSMHGEWEFNTDWKPIKGFPAYLKWIYAVNKAQKKLHLNSDIPIPILILHSDASSNPRKWGDILKKTDMVLNVNHIRKYGEKLGDDVSFAKIPGAIHDVFLSEQAVREKAFETTFQFLSKD